MKILLLVMSFSVAITGTAGAAYAVRHYFYAACLHESHGFIGFNGKRHVDATDAGKDCDEHRRIYPRHRCTIRPIDY